MKNKILSVSLFVMILFTTISQSVISSFADDDQPGYTISSCSTKTGDLFTIDLGIENNPGIVSLRLSIEFDENNLELIETASSFLLNGWTSPSSDKSSPYILRWTDSLAQTDNASNGIIGTLTFKAKNKLGNTFISVSPIEARNNTGIKIGFNGIMSAVSVLCNHTSNGWETQLHPTCTKEGVEIKKCIYCDAVIDSRNIQATGHNYGAWKVRTPATFTEPGIEYRTCLECDHEDISSTDVEKEILESISIGGDIKTEYIEGEPFYIENLTLVLTYNSGRISEEFITPDMVSGYNAELIGIQTITVTYGGMSCTFTVEVINEIHSHQNKGDVDGDGEITIRDAIEIFRHLAGKIILIDSSANAADVNKDNEISIKDAIIIFRYLAGKIAIVEM